MTDISWFIFIAFAVCANLYAMFVSPVGGICMLLGMIMLILIAILDVMLIKK